MANTFLTPSIIAKAALATLYETCVMAQLVHRDYEQEFVSRVGDTISVRKPAVFQANEFNRAQGIQIQNASEGSVPITLNHFSDVSFAVTAEELTLEIEDFGTQLLNPAMEAISQKIDRDILSLRNDIVQRVGVPGTTPAGVTGEVIHPYDDPKTAIDARRVLNQRNVPAADRHLVIGPEIEALWLSDPLFHQADVRGTRTVSARLRWVGGFSVTMPSRRRTSTRRPVRRPLASRTPRSEWLFTGRRSRW
ncbi:P22 phage major capsid protein family protein [Nonomuraea thailandensis]